MIGILASLWFIRQTKTALFYIYLCQLKEYHWGRFLAHFQTSKGKSLIINWLFILKLLLLSFFFIDLQIFWIVLLIYLGESGWFFRNLLLGKAKKPVLTPKTAVLITGFSILNALIALFLSSSIKEFRLIAFYLLLLDLLSPFIFPALIFALEPATIIWRNRILKRAAQKRRSFKNLKVVGITGSYGKTSTKEFLATILSGRFKVLKTKEHQNSEIGIARCILNELKPEHEVFVVEMGAYQTGGIRLLCDIARPQIGILTGINEQHMSTFGSQENIIKTKYELIENLPKDGVAFFNGKNRYCRELYERTNLKKYLYGVGAALGRENLEGARMVAKELGMSDEEIAQVSKEFEDKIPGIEIKKGVNDVIIIDASYSANPDGVMIHLEYLKNFHGKKIIIMPCLIELGKAAKSVHRRIGGKIQEICDLAIITTRDYFKDLKGNNDKVILMESPEGIFKKVREFTRSGDTILLEGRIPKRLSKLLYNI